MQARNQHHRTGQHQDVAELPEIHCRLRNRALWRNKVPADSARRHLHKASYTG